MEWVALEALAVSKRYGDLEALCGVDLIARGACVHGLLGLNGAGKTTLMRIALGLVRRDAGTVRLLGCPLDSTAGPVPDGVAGFVDAPAFYPYLSGRRNLALLDRLDDGTGPGRVDKIDQLLEQVGLTAQANLAVRGYSAGMRQRLGIAAALLRTPRLLLLDEPTSSLDAAGARDVRALVTRLAAEGAAVLLSSHDMEEVEELCTTLTIIDCGRVVFCGTVDELRTRAPEPMRALRTSDDRAAMDLAARQSGLTAAFDPDGNGLVVSAGIEAFDAYVISLGRAGVAVRTVETRGPSLEGLFLQLTKPHGAMEQPTPRRAH